MLYINFHQMGCSKLILEQLSTLRKTTNLKCPQNQFYRPSDFSPVATFLKILVNLMILSGFQFEHQFLTPKISSHRLWCWKERKKSCHIHHDKGDVTFWQVKSWVSHPAFFQSQGEHQESLLHSDCASLSASDITFVMVNVTTFFLLHSHCEKMYWLYTGASFIWRVFDGTS
jgi:hypothetical protein